MNGSEDASLYATQPRSRRSRPITSFCDLKQEIDEFKEESKRFTLRFRRFHANFPQIPRDANTKGDDDDCSYAGLPINLHLRIVSPCRPPMSSILQQNLRISDGNEPTSLDRDSSAEKSLSVSDQNIRRSKVRHKSNE
ncbi:hypothetical protein L3X38_035443 [Prunus dulcis]|uniref:Uncharacterized protein n=1 Tax=Prunus dulcis TaxID=3755 RepID=A0AAD4VJP9_PRUDU|nr:hypothetical protein L3X38_035443 [Prunus dulcis]